MATETKRVIKVKVEPLTAEAYAPYGALVDVGRLQLHCSDGQYTARLMAALATAGIPTSWISTSQMRLSVIVPRERTVDAVETLHREFHLDRHEPTDVTSATSGRSATV